MSSTILMVIVLVVMWLVVLVPMFVRKHDEADEERSVDRFATAMRVLRRRTEAEDPVPHPVARAGARAEARARLLARRRRTCAGLLLVAVLGAVGALLLTRWLWVASAVGAMLVVAYVCGLRRQIRRDQERRSWRAAQLTRPERPGHATRVEQARARLAGRSHTVRTGRGATAAQTRRAGTAATGHDVEWAGAGWQPVPVPVPTYVTKPAAPGVSGASVVGLDDDDPIFAEIEEAEIAERPRAVND